jgi:hypothetical protein
MATTTISQYEIDAAPKVTLGGKEYPVPFLVPRQQRVVIPKLLGLMKSMTVGNKITVTDLTTDQYDDLINMTYVALTRGSPALKIDELLDAPIDLMELVTAMQVIASQTGVMKKANGTEVATGEAPAGE